MTYDLAPEEPTSPPPRGLPQFDSQMRPVRRRSGYIEEDTPCMRCGYNLRTLRRHGRCPECGAPVVVSAVGDDLINASPVWLRQVQGGLALVLWSTVLGFASLLCSTVPVMSAGIASIAALLGVWGIFLLTTQEPRERVSDRGSALRTGLRGAALVEFGCAVVVALGHLVGLKLSILGWLACLSLLVNMAVILGISLFLRGLAARMEDVEIERSTVTVMWGLMGCMAIMAFLTPLNLVLAGRSLGPALCGMIGVSFALGFFLLWFLKLLYRYHGVIRWVAYEAEYKLEKETP